MSTGSRDGKGGDELWELARLFTKLGFIAIVARALWRLPKTVVKGWSTAAVEAVR